MTKALVSDGMPHPLKRWLRTVATLLALPIAAWAGPACLAPYDGIGGTGAPAADHGGIGGTGASTERGGIGGTGSPAKGGIGGTGQQADGGIGGTGIVGIVTGFGSVCVNGLEVDYRGSTPVSMNGLPARSDDLAVGQVVAIDASGAGPALVANRIGILNVLEGPVTEAYTDVDTLYVMGQRVRVTSDTQLGGMASLGETRTGLPLRVSGYRNAAGEVVASRIEAVGDLAEVSIIGTLSSDSAGSLAVAGLPVQTSAAPAAGGTEALIRGSWDGQRLHATSIHRDPFLPFAGNVGHVVVEGLVLKREGTRQLTINGFDIALSAATSVHGGDVGEAQEGRRVRVSGRLVEGRRVTADHIELLHLTSMQPMGDIGRPLDTRARSMGDVAKPMTHAGQPTSNMGHADPAGLAVTMPMATPGTINLPEMMSPAGMSIGAGRGTSPGMSFPGDAMGTGSGTGTMPGGTPAPGAGSGMMGSMPGGTSSSGATMGGGMGGMHR